MASDPQDWIREGLERYRKRRASMPPTEPESQPPQPADPWPGDEDDEDWDEWTAFETTEPAKPRQSIFDLIVEAVLLGLLASVAVILLACAWRLFAGW